MIFQVIMIGSIIINIKVGKSSNPEHIFDFIKYFPSFIILLTGVLFGWLWSIAIGLQSKVPETIKMKVKKFKILFLKPKKNSPKKNVLG